jgi:hypothetical protein
MPKRPDMKRTLKRKNSWARKDLSDAFRSLRERDKGDDQLPYTINRSLTQAPFRNELEGTLKKKLGKKKDGPIRVMDKGAGTGSMLVEVKSIAPKDIDVTAVSLSRTITPKNRRSIDKVNLGFGITATHPEKFDVIYDCYGEDYHLPKGKYPKEMWGRTRTRRIHPEDNFIRYSLEKSIADLKNGGELFTVISLHQRSEPGLLTIEEGKKMIRDLSKRKDVSISTNEEYKRFASTDYLDLVVHVKKK